MKRVSGLINVLACVCAVTLGVTSLDARTETYPSKAIRVIVPFPPGGSVDIVGRIVAQDLSKKLGVPVYVENKAGAGGAIGASEVAKALPDGYTLLIVATHHSINPSLQKNLSYNPLKDFTAIGRIITTPSVLVVGAGTPYKTLDDLVRHGKQESNGINYGSTGIGGVNHLTGELFKSMTGVHMTHIPYKGAAPAMSDLLGGQIAVMFDSPPTVVGQVKAGKIRALAVSSSTRSPMLPDVPTFQEAGIKLETVGWAGLVGPAGLPPEIQLKLSSALVDFVRTPMAREKFAELGVESAPMSHAAFDAFFRAEVAKWGQVIERAGIRAE